MKKMSQFGLLIIGAMITFSALAVPTVPTPWTPATPYGAHPGMFSSR